MSECNFEEYTSVVVVVIIILIVLGSVNLSWGAGVNGGRVDFITSNDRGVRALLLTQGFIYIILYMKVSRRFRVLGSTHTATLIGPYPATSPAWVGVPPECPLHGDSLDGAELGPRSPAWEDDRPTSG